MARTILLMLFVIAYMTFTGFPVSVVRAGVMLLFASLYYLLALPRDSLTVLSLSVLLIVLVTPYAIVDVSLLLSALATFGILRATEKSENKKEKTKGFLARLLSPLYLSLTLSVFAIVYTTPVSFLSFDEVSLLSAISTFLFAFLVEGFVYLGLLALVLPLSGALAWLLDVLYQGIGWLARGLSAIPYVSVSVRFPFLSVLLLVAMGSLLFVLLIKTKKRRISVLVVALAFGMLYGSALVATVISHHTDDVVYFYDQKREMMLLKSEGDVLLLDYSSYSSKNGRDAAEILYDEHITRIDKLFFTSYGTRLPEHLEVYLRSFLTDTVYLPSPKEAEEAMILETICPIAEKYRVTLFFYDEGERIEHEEMTLTVHGIKAKSEGQSPILSFDYQEESYLYIASGAMDGKNEIAVTELQRASDAVVFGYRGTGYSPNLRIFEFLGKTTRMIVSDPDVILEDNAKNAMIQNGWITFYPSRRSLIR